MQNRSFELIISSQFGDFTRQQPIKEMMDSLVYAAKAIHLHYGCSELREYLKVSLSAVWMATPGMREMLFP